MERHRVEGTVIIWYPHQLVPSGITTMNAVQKLITCSQQKVGAKFIG
jgi:hypothetical protein